MSAITVIRPRPPVSIIRSDGRLRVNSGGPGLRGLPGATGAAGGFTGSEAAAGRLRGTDTLPVKVSGLSLMASVDKLRNILGLYRRGGTMTGLTGDSLLHMPTSTAAPTFDDPSATVSASVSNGATISAVGAWTYNNSTFGGAGGALHASVAALCNAALAVDAGYDYRYGFPWYVALLTAGAGTGSAGTGDATGTYLALAPINNVSATTAITARIMARVTSGTAFFLKNTGTEFFKNGAAVTSGWVPLEATWRHYIELQPVGGISSRKYSMPFRFYCSPGATVEFALPDFTPGHVDVPFIAHPLLAGNRS